MRVQMPARYSSWRLIPLLLLCVVLIILVLALEFKAPERQSSAQPAGMAHRRPFIAAEPARCQTETRYISSAMEQAWITNAVAWEKDYCNAVNTPQQTAWTKIWLDTVKQEQYAGSASQQITYDPSVFSRFVTKTTCAGETTEITTYIEPLAHGLRHPHVFCGMGSNVFNRGYLLIANQANVHRLRAASTADSTQACTNRTCQNIYIDLGGTTWEGADPAGQGWFYTQYQQRGLEMDRLLLWEAVAQTPPTKIYKRLPKELLHKYQYFNIPADTDFTQASHPVRILKTIAQPQDFVVFKLDIDNAGVETAILQALMDDPEAFALVDEFFFEYHVTFQPMMAWWAGSADVSKGLLDAFKVFYELRKRGWRAHSWV